MRGVRLRAWALGVQVLRYNIWGFGCRVWDSGLRGLDFWALGLQARFGAWEFWWRSFSVFSVKRARPTRAELVVTVWFGLEIAGLGS